MNLLFSLHAVATEFSSFLFRRRQLQQISNFMDSSFCTYLYCVKLLLYCAILELSQIDLVPESCCRRATYDWDRILNQWVCQKTQGGPPRTKYGSPNGYLNYRVSTSLLWYFPRHRPIMLLESVSDSKADWPRVQPDWPS